MRLGLEEAARPGSDSKNLCNTTFPFSATSTTHLRSYIPLVKQCYNDYPVCSRFHTEMTQKVDEWM